MAQSRGQTTRCHLVRNKIRTLCLLTIVPLLTQCGSGSSDSGASASPGATPFNGVWTLVATLNVNLGGTATFLTDTSEVEVGRDGNVAVRSTDSECSLDVTVSGDVMTYETQCIFTATSEDASAPCTLTLVTRARIRGTPGDANLFGSFGPETEVCRGVAVSYTGNLVGNQGEADDQDTVNGTDNGGDEA